MSVKLKWDGLNEFRGELKQMPEHLADEANEIVVSAASGAANTIRTNYPQGPTGNLKRGVRLDLDRTPARARAIVSSRAPHAWLFEKGTVPRKNRRGAYRGAMPPASDAQAFIPTVIRARARMVQALIALLEREGFVVTAA